MIMKFFALLFIYLLPLYSLLAQTFSHSIDLRHNNLSGVGSSQAKYSWVKFIILKANLNRVYFQNSRRFPFHFDFASSELDLFKGMNHIEFERKTSYEGANRLAYLGAILFPQGPSAKREVGVQIVGKNQINKDVTLQLLQSIKNSIKDANKTQFYYFPSSEQFNGASNNSEFYKTSGFPLSSANIWQEGDGCYANGWAIGRLRYFSQDKITEAVQSGELITSDILFTDRVPTEIPIIAGLISKDPSTPNSHAALLSQSNGVPFAHSQNSALVQELESLKGKKIAFEVKSDAFGDCKIRVFDLDDKSDESLVNWLSSFKTLSKIDFPKKEKLEKIVVDIEDIGREDMKYFGGKAANFSFLRKSIPNNSPVAMGISFDLWDEFVGQTLTSGKTLKKTIEEELQGISFPPQNYFTLKEKLSKVRKLIKKETKFTESRKKSLIAVLSAKFNNINKKLRFRSSTNLEDGDSFNGAGLYSSYSGCLADDKDSNDTGPSLCDRSKEKERSIFRAIKKVYASFYNDKAFLERRRHDIEENEVGMAILVHHSFPDENELANGVATIHGIRDEQPSADIVSQLGSHSVANPQNGQTPEVTNVTEYSWGPMVEYGQSSSLAAPMQKVLGDEKTYLELFELMKKVYAVYPVTGEKNLKLDFEYKKIVNIGLVIKQVRPVPQREYSEVVPFLVGQKKEYCVFQGENSFGLGRGGLFSYHRLKGVLNIESKSGSFGTIGNSQSLLKNINYQYQDEIGKPLSLELNTSNSDNYNFESGQRGSVDSWKVKNEEIKISTVIAGHIGRMSTKLLPVIGQEKFHFGIHIDRKKPLVEIDDMGGFTTSSTDKAMLVRFCPDSTSLPAGSSLQERSFRGPVYGERITLKFYWPPEPDGMVAGYTAPLQKWANSTITGLTTKPLTFTTDFSQTYFPGHHNFSEDFLLDPSREPTVTQEQLDQLKRKGIRYILLRKTSWGDNKVTYIDWDGVPVAYL